MSALPRLPTIREELDRKAFETIDWLITSYDKGKLTEPQFRCGLDALFMATSGLVDADVVDLITTASDEVPAKLAVIKRHFVKENLIVTLEWTADESIMKVEKRLDGSEIGGPTITAASPEMARKAMERAAGKLIGEGYAEL